MVGKRTQILKIGLKDDTFGVRKRFTKNNPNKVVTRVDFLPFKIGRGGQKAKITFRKRK